MTLLKSTITQYVKFDSAEEFETYILNIQAHKSVEFFHVNPDGTVFALVHIITK